MTSADVPTVDMEVYLQTNINAKGRVIFVNFNLDTPQKK